MSLRERCRVIIDLHCHILPNIDDGAENIEETIEMLSIAAEEGIQGMIATSHAEAEVGPKQSEKYLKAYRKTLQYIESNDIPITARNMLRDKQEPIDILDNIDEDLVNKLLKALLEILDVQEQTVSIDKVHADEIREYLALLDLIIEIDQMYCLDLRHGDKITAISQPGMRYAQAEALVKSLLLDPKFNQLSINEREVVISRLLSEIKGRMMEDIVLLETKLAHPNKEVFQLKFAVGEFDMVIHDPKTLTCQIFEIKYSKEVVSNQYRHLIDNEKCSETEHRFGRITDKIVIYRGDGAVSDGVQYINVETYLNSLA
jgi:hypothetical protein